MLLPRIITALIGIPIVAVLVHIGNFPFMAFIFAVVLLCLYEYRSMLKSGRKPVDSFALFISGFLLPPALFLEFSANPGIAAYGLSFFFLIFLFILTVFLEFFRSRKYLERISFTWFGITMISCTLPFLTGIRNIRPDGETITFILIISVWIMDSAAYFIGRSLGSRRLSPISPKKTWEGAAAGFAGALASVFLIRFFMPNSISPAAAWGLGALIGILGQASDLAESMVKRAVHAKDSSALLPGHGGILDRFDSYIFLAPAVYYFFLFIR